MNLISMGYLYRQVAKRPEWLRAGQVEDSSRVNFRSADRKAALSTAPLI